VRSRAIISKLALSKKFLCVKHRQRFQQTENFSSVFSKTVAENGPSTAHIQIFISIHRLVSSQSSCINIATSLRSRCEPAAALREGAIVSRAMAGHFRSGRTTTTQQPTNTWSLQPWSMTIGSYSMLQRRCQLAHAHPLADGTCVTGRGHGQTHRLFTPPDPG
jgi:hypothetical protein